MRSATALALLLAALLLTGCITPTAERPPAPEMLECGLEEEGPERDRCLARLAPYTAWDDADEALSMCRDISDSNRRDGCLRLTAIEVAKNEPEKGMTACRSLVDEDRRSMCLNRLLPWVDLRSRVHVLIETRPKVAGAIGVVIFGLFVLFVLLLLKFRKVETPHVVEDEPETNLATYESYYANMYAQSYYATPPPPPPVQEEKPVEERLEKVRMLDDDGNVVEVYLEND
jgi:hypothetical protein